MIENYFLTIRMIKGIVTAVIMVTVSAYAWTRVRSC